MALFQFDATNVERRPNTFELLPAGWYTAQITESSIEPLRSGNGEALKLTFQILQDGYNGRKVWSRLNVKHTNAQTEKIAQQQLAELIDATGIGKIHRDTSELHMRPVQIRVKIRKDETGQYEDSNDVAGFRALSGGSPTQMPGPVVAAAAASAAPRAAAPPWQRK